MIYFVQRQDGKIKIGTTKNFALRLTALKIDHGPLVLLGWVQGGRPEEAEMHQRFKAHRLTPQGELFADCEEIREYIRRIANKTPPPVVHPTTNIVLADGQEEKIERLHILLEKMGVNLRNPNRQNCFSDTLLFRYLIDDKLSQLEVMSQQASEVVI